MTILLLLSPNLLKLKEYICVCVFCLIIKKKLQIYFKQTPYCTVGHYKIIEVGNSPLLVTIF
jgi:hypothetical protein